MSPHPHIHPYTRRSTCVQWGMAVTYQWFRSKIDPFGTNFIFIALR